MRRITASAAVLTLAFVGFDAAGTTATAPSPILSPGAAPPPLKYTRGFGQVRPRIIYLGGDPTGVVCRIHWLTWGGRFAVGLGTAKDVIGRQDVAAGHWTAAVVVLSHLGAWHRRPAYKRFDWSFPDGEVTPQSRPCTL
jgi:hypothetical protein